MIKGSNDRIFDIVMVMFCLLLFINVAWVLLFVISASLSDPKLVVNGKVFLVPRQLNLNAYKTMLAQKDVWMGYRNSIFYTAAGTAIQVIVTLLTAYPLSRRDMQGKGIITFIFIFTMYFSGGLIPTFLLIKALGLYNTFWVMVIPGAVGIQNIIICRTYMQRSIPYELQEAARIDGASDFKILFRIMIPLAAPIIAVLMLFFAVGHWNTYFNALVYLKSRSLYPLQIFLREILILSQTVYLEGLTATEMLVVLKKVDEAELMRYALIIVASLPFLLIYPFLQKYFLRGIMIGAIKG